MYTGRTGAARHLRGEQALALYERAAGLDQVVHDDDVPALGHALLQAHDALVAVAHLGADHLRARALRIPYRCPALHAASGRRTALPEGPARWPGGAFCLARRPGAPPAAPPV